MASDALDIGPSPRTTSHAQKRNVITLVVAESYPIILEGLRRVLTSDAGFTVLACCADGDEALLAVRDHRPDVVVLDLRIRGKHALAVLRDIAAEAAPSRVVLLVDSLSEEEMLEATRLGVRGIIRMTMACDVLARCVRTVHRGAMWIEKVSMGRAFDRLLREDVGYRDTTSRLSRREFEVLCLIARAHSNKGIADKLHISEGTVKSHLHHVYEKLGVSGRLELILYARDKGLLSGLLSDHTSTPAR
jgi:DNA-binding NarL/FixJ family response regulator